ncbi:hypothetical protein B0H66DRAFT_227174 [Apodospora peruviana]|uniref:Fungal N-terminal domain-containing protein n=1 Tax=Apodospora peruviana TaxID=516989 RepID=A0AAE0M4A4_9PEZI|nr:hypothetical protein B0H66DRAFT_227174 [Apodospora peruviana]
MDPISIISVVVSTTSSCLSTAKKLYDLREKYNDAPVVVVSICSESNVILASLTQMQMLLLQKKSMTDVPPEFPAVLDQAVTGCMVVFSCLDLELQRMVSRGSEPKRILWRARVRLVWNETKLTELLGALRGQQAAINLFIQLLQLNTLGEIKHMLQQQRSTVQTSAQITQSLRSQNPSIKVPNSVYGGQERSVAGFPVDAVSMTAPSDLEFDFDDVAVNSRVYRRTLAQAQVQTQTTTHNQIPRLSDQPDPKPANQANPILYPEGWSSDSSVYADQLLHSPNDSDVRNPATPSSAATPSPTDPPQKEDKILNTNLVSHLESDIGEGIKPLTAAIQTHEVNPVSPVAQDDVRRPPPVYAASTTLAVPAIPSAQASKHQGISSTRTKVPSVNNAQFHDATEDAVKNISTATPTLPRSRGRRDMDWVSSFAMGRRGGYPGRGGSRY